MSIQPSALRRTLPGELAELLRHMIVEGELRPGSKMAEQKLCAHFGVSRTPLREAFKVLSAEGLVRLLPNRGATVARITRAKAEEIIPMLGALEAFAGELACARIDDEWVVRIQRMHKQMVDHYRRGEERSYDDLSRAIREAIFDAANNQTLFDIHSMLQSRLRSQFFGSPKAPAEWAAAVEDHERMMEALEARDGAQFAIIARRHMRHTADLVRKALDALVIEATQKLIERFEQ